MYEFIFFFYLVKFIKSYKILIHKKILTQKVRTIKPHLPDKNLWDLAPTRLPGFTVPIHSTTLNKVLVIFCSCLLYTSDAADDTINV